MLVISAILMIEASDFLEMFTGTGTAEVIRKMYLGNFLRILIATS